MTDIEESLTTLFGGTAVIFVGLVVGKLFALLGQVVIVRNLSPSVFGTLALGYTIATLVANLVVVGIPEGIARYLGTGRGDPDTVGLEVAGFAIVTSVACAAAGLVYVSRDFVSKLLDSPPLSELLPIFAAYVVVLAVAKTTISVLRGHEVTTRATLARDIVPKAGAFFVLCLWLWFGRPYDGALAYWLSIPFFMLVTAGIFAIRRVSFRVPSPETVHRLLSFSWPLAFEGALVLFMGHIDILMIGYFRTQTEVGYYKAVQPLALIVLFFLNALVFVYLPVATRHFENRELEHLRTLFKTGTKWVSLATCPLVVLLAVFSEGVLRVLYDPAYTAGAVALSILAVGTYLRVVVGPTGATIKAIDRTKVDLVASAVGLGVNVGANLLLIPRYGIVGAAIGTSLGYLAFNVVDLVVIYRSVSAVPFSASAVVPIGLTAVTAVGIRSLFAGGRSPVELAVIGVVLVVAEGAFLFGGTGLDEEDAVLVALVEEKFGVSVPLPGTDFE